MSQDNDGKPSTHIPPLLPIPSQFNRPLAGGGFEKKEATLKDDNKHTPGGGGATKKVKNWTERNKGRSRNENGDGNVLGEEGRSYCAGQARDSDRNRGRNTRGMQYRGRNTRGMQYRGQRNYGPRNDSGADNDMQGGLGKRNQGNPERSGHGYYGARFNGRGHERRGSGHDDENGPRNNFQGNQRAYNNYQSSGRGGNQGYPGRLDGAWYNGRGFGRSGRGEHENEQHGPRNDHQSQSGSDDIQVGGRGRYGGNPNCNNGRGQGRVGRGGLAGSRGDREWVQMPISYAKLEEWSRKEDSTELVNYVANARNGFFLLMEADDQTLTYDKIGLIVQILAKVCTADFQETKKEILVKTCKCKKFIDRLTSHMSSFVANKIEKRKAVIPAFFEHLLEFCSTVMRLAPQTACENLAVTLTLTGGAIANAVTYQKINLPQNLTDKVGHVTEKLKRLTEERDRRERDARKSSRRNQMHLQPPPDDYRQISIFPRPEDILAQRPAFVRPNIVHGAYQDVNHYLDVQFRLLREDFVSPLREGINNVHLNETSKKKTGNIRIYQKVQFESIHVTKDQPGVVVCLGKKTTAINWERSKRLMFGSLLCFTKDNFVNIIFATVSDRDLVRLNKNRLVVAISQETCTEELCYNVDYTMIESEVFFPPYQHVLAALQHITEDNFPMSRYIVDVRPDTDPPQYLAGQYNFEYDVDGYKIPVLHPDHWPLPVALGLDNSQYRAFQMALTREFVVIQGPPGTGKTYLGLKIARTLLTNVNRLLVARRAGIVLEADQRNFPQQRQIANQVYAADLRNVASTPILVVSVTNHALDQFLEGLMKATERIIRVGGQSHSNLLQQFNLREVRKQVRRDTISAARSRELHNLMSDLMGRIKGIESDLSKINGWFGIISVESLATVVEEHAFDAFRKNGQISNDFLLEWLLEGAEQFKPTDQPPHYAPPQPPGEEDGALENTVEARRSDAAWQRGARDNYDLHVVERASVEFEESSYAMRERLIEIEDLMHSGRYNGYDLEWEKQILKQKLAYMEHCLQHPPPHKLKGFNLHRVNLWRLEFNERWAVYRNWLGLLRQNVLEELRGVEARYCQLARQVDELRDEESLELMKDADVVGMTTTMAAQSQQLLQALRPRIVIVEEAAEAMESHIVVSLSAHCQHLILIGDHKQLRPTTAVYRLAREYKFDISLFERMLNNGLHCEQLMVQHRMRPEIAQLIVPAVYEQLIDHESVKLYDRVLGMDKSLFFFTHNNPEQEVGESSSKQNNFEGDLTLALACHILLQGYEADRVTILTTYSGQMFYLRQERMHYPLLQEVEITLVDNFQGEENDIILLSLVRNNEDNNIGFLNIENRVCVALSRAKHGMYILGNIDNLTSSSSVWPKIKEVLDEQNAVGEEIILKCEIHQDQLTPIRCKKDFDKVPEGGCGRECAAVLACGHQCKDLCHIPDRDHQKEHRCIRDCTRIPPRCPLEHTCIRRCHHDCGDCLVPLPHVLACGHEVTLACHVNVAEYECQVKVDGVGPCGHQYDRPCSVPQGKAECPHPCEVRLDCGHACRQKCHVNEDPDHLEYKCMEACTLRNDGCSRNHDCSRRCWEECGACAVEVVKEGARCDHRHKVACSMPQEEIRCLRLCKRKIPECGHNCKKECNKPCGDCPEMVVKVVESCGHEVRIACKDAAERRHCRKPCERLTSCGHPCMRACKVECTAAADCEALVPSKVTPACGHEVEVPCSVNARCLDTYSSELLSLCTVKCNSQLQCEHPCKGTCGQCMNGRIHAGCESKCGRTLICGHNCKEPCAEACSACKAPCPMKCNHSQCKKQCGVPCTSCMERCSWRCEHFRCTKRCGEPCNRPPCYKPCKRLLKCKHPCIGFCGEPCPPLCRRCNKKKVTEILFGAEDEPDARFVYLVDCKHSIESTGLENWLNQVAEEGKDEEVKMPQCPKCKTDIIRTQRFADIVKLRFRDVLEIKQKIFGAWPEINKRRRELIEQLKMIAKNTDLQVYYKKCQVRQGKHNKLVTYEIITRIGPGFTPPVEKFFRKLFSQLQLVVNNRNNFLCQKDVEARSIQVDIFAQLWQIYYGKFHTRTDSMTDQLHFLVKIIEQRSHWSTQDVNDINLELLRFRRLVQFCQIRNNIPGAQTPQSQDYATVRQAVISIEKYSDDLDKTVDDLLKKLGTGVEEIEFKMVVAAMGMKKGHWFKCQNGHYYVIGECGGATEKGKCPDCKKEVGGSQHRLLPTNAVATEIDGARMGAYDHDVALAHNFF